MQLGPERGKTSQQYAFQGLIGVMGSIEITRVIRDHIQPAPPERSRFPGINRIRQRNERKQAQPRSEDGTPSQEQVIEARTNLEKRGNEKTRSRGHRVPQ